MLLATIAFALVYGAAAAGETRAAGGVAAPPLPDIGEQHRPAVEIGSTRGDTSKLEVPGKKMTPAGRQVAGDRGSIRSDRQGEMLRPAAGLPRRGTGSPSAPNAGLRTRASPPLGGYAPRMWQTDHPAGGRDPVARAPRGGAALSLALGRQFSPPSLAAGRLAASLHAQAGNGVIGGARATGLSGLGGPVNSRTVIKSSIDGSALHRRS